MSDRERARYLERLVVRGRQDFLADVSREQVKIELGKDYRSWFRGYAKIEKEWRIRRETRGESLGLILLEARQRRHMKQTEAAYAVDIHPGYLCRIEKDHEEISIPSFTLVRRLCLLYGLDIGDVCKKLDEAGQ